MAARELFVWYRVRRERADAARMAVSAMQRSLREARPGLEARLLARDDDGLSTWMETYSMPTRGGIDAATEAAIASAALALDGLIDGSRHVEAFAPVA